MSGQVYGKAGTSLGAGDFAANAQVRKLGMQAELETQKILDALAVQRGFTVLHDLSIPGAKANIDHVVVSGNSVWLIDTKRWRGGVYWTVFGKTFVGLKRFSAHTRDGALAYPAEKRTMGLALSKLLPLIGGVTRFRKPLLVVHSAGDKAKLWLLRPPDAKAIPPRRLLSALPKHGLPGDPRIVNALKALL